MTDLEEDPYMDLAAAGADDWETASEGEAVTKAPIDWNHLNADDHEKLEKMMAPYHAIEDQSWEARAKGKRGGTIGHSAMRVLKAFFTFMLRRPGASLRRPTRPPPKRPCSAPGQSGARSGGQAANIPWMHAVVGRCEDFLHSSELPDRGFIGRPAQGSVAPRKPSSGLGQAGI